MKLHNKYQRPGPSDFRQKNVLSFQLKSIFNSCDLDPLNNFERGPTKIIPMKLRVKIQSGI